MELAGPFLLLAVLLGTNIIAPRPALMVPADCPGRLAMIDDAITAWALGNGQSTTQFPAEAEVLRHLRWKEAARCPPGGQYKFGTLALATTCSVHGHAHVGPRPPPSSRFKKLWDALPNPFHPFRARVTSGQNSCLANLKQIDGAIEQWALENKQAAGTPADAVEILGFLKDSNLPLGRQQGKYIWRKVDASPECTVIGHNLGR